METIFHTPFEITSAEDGLARVCHVRFLIGGEWAQASPIRVFGPVNELKAAEQAFDELFVRGQLETWAEPTPTMHFHVYVNGVQRPARVARESVPLALGREGFLRSAQGAELRETAVKRLRASNNEVIRL